MCMFLCVCIGIMWLITSRVGAKLPMGIRNFDGVNLEKVELPPYFECCIPSFGWSPGVWILCAGVSEPSVHSSLVVLSGRNFCRQFNTSLLVDMKVLSGQIMQTGNVSFTLYANHYSTLVFVPFTRGKIFLIFILKKSCWILHECYLENCNCATLRIDT